MSKPFYEFFAGAGMARAGLGAGWECLFANDIDLKKCATYEENWRDGVIRPADVKSLSVADLPGEPALIWGSFPCQDLSLAGAGAGLRGDRSGTFWPFWRLLSDLVDQGRAPAIIALENVAATLTSHGGKDFEALCEALVSKGYRLGARVIDAVQFVPQSRPRMFLIAVRQDVDVPSNLIGSAEAIIAADKAVATALSKMRLRSDDMPALKLVLDRWINWSLPLPRRNVQSLHDIIEPNPTTVTWHSKEESIALLEQMSDLNKRKLAEARSSGKIVYGTAYRRTRVESGRKVVRTEIRFDGVAGCLRTPSGGSSRQIVIEVKGTSTRSRLMTIREGARLMGLPEEYVLPAAYNEGYHLVGDGVAVGVVRYLAETIFEPIIDGMRDYVRKAA